MVVLNKPILIYDGDCGFCKRWIEKWKIITGTVLDYAPYQQVATQFPQIKLEEFQKAVQYVNQDGQQFSGAHAVFLSLSHNPKFRWTLTAYQILPPFRWLTELAYKIVARNRKLFSKILK